MFIQESNTDLIFFFWGGVTAYIAQTKHLLQEQRVGCESLQSFLLFLNGMPALIQ